MSAGPKSSPLGWDRGGHLLLHRTHPRKFGARLVHACTPRITQSPLLQKWLVRTRPENVCPDCIATAEYEGLEAKL